MCLKTQSPDLTGIWTVKARGALKTKTKTKKAQQQRQKHKSKKNHKNHLFTVTKKQFTGNTTGRQQRKPQHQVLNKALLSNSCSLMLSVGHRAPHWLCCPRDLERTGPDQRGSPSAFLAFARSPTASYVCAPHELVFLVLPSPGISALPMKTPLLLRMRPACSRIPVSLIFSNLNFPVSQVAGLIFLKHCSQTSKQPTQNVSGQHGESNNGKRVSVQGYYCKLQQDLAPLVPKSV